MATNTKGCVRLTPEQREELEAICRLQNVGAAKARRARILLLADEVHVDGRRSDRTIAEIVGRSERQVARIRNRFVREGPTATERRPYPPLEGAAEVSRRPLDAVERWSDSEPGLCAALAPVEFLLDPAPFTPPPENLAAPTPRAASRVGLTGEGLGFYHPGRLPRSGR